MVLLMQDKNPINDLDRWCWGGGGLQTVCKTELHLIGLEK